MDFSDFSGELSADATGDEGAEGWNDGAEYECGRWRSGGAASEDSASALCCKVDAKAVGKKTPHHPCRL